MVIQLMRAVTDDDLKRFRRHVEFLSYTQEHTMGTFPNKDCGLKNDYLPTVGHWMPHITVVIWSWR